MQIANFQVKVTDVEVFCFLDVEIPGQKAAAWPCKRCLFISVTVQIFHINPNEWPEGICI